MSWPPAVAAGDTEAAHLEEFTGFSPFISFFSFIGNPAYSNLVSPPLPACLSARHIYPTCSWSSLLWWPTHSSNSPGLKFSYFVSPTIHALFLDVIFWWIVPSSKFPEDETFPPPTSYMHQILYLLNKSDIHVPSFRFISHMYYNLLRKPCWSFTMSLSYSEVFSDACHHL